MHIKGTIESSPTGPLIRLAARDNFGLLPPDEAVLSKPRLDGKQDRHQFQAAVRQVLKREDFETLDILGDELRRSRELLNDGNSLSEAFFSAFRLDSDTFIHLIGTPHPSPAKAKQFREVDLVSIQVVVKAAREAEVKHFIYLSVAHPAPMMHAFIEVRREGEEMIRASGMNATFLRPWYVLGPGHRWAYALLPFYWICERLPSTRESAQRLGLITLMQMLNALIYSVENPPAGIRILEVPEMRRLADV